MAQWRRVSYTDYDGDGVVDIYRNGVDIDGDFDDENDLVQIKSYYPFGLEHNYGNASPLSIINGRNHKWTFNNKEFNDEFGLNWYDFDARNYDASLGRWMNIDNFSESYYQYSPYEYSLNSPIIFVDPDGNTVKPSFVNKENEKKFNEASTRLKSLSSIYNEVYFDLDNSWKDYDVLEFTPEQISSDYNGYYNRYKGWGFFDTREIRLNHKRRGFEMGVIFEEFFHAGQDGYYDYYNEARNETEAKLARDFEVFQNAKSHTLEDIKNAMEEFGTDTDVSILLNEDGSLNCDAINFFTALQNGDKFTEEMKKTVKDFTKKIDGYYHFKKKDLDNYDGSIDYFLSFLEN
ncbi:MAG: hypothetical protein HRT68_12780 [Flavobacteriaceae bacterium]|nr:hypothetical protein [Flavobacteriaceae bacterium]